MSSRTEKATEHDLIRQADALGIPWQRILAEEIRSERLLRISLADVSDDWPLWSVFSILPLTFLNSWRVRERIHTLAWQASEQRREEAARELRALHAHLSGRQNGRRSDATLMARHLWFGYQRVLALVRLARLAERLRRDSGDPVEVLRERTGCSYPDAVWAFERCRSGVRGHSLDDAMRRVRDEGFELPEAENEVRAFRRLRSHVRSAVAPRRAPRAF